MKISNIFLSVKSLFFVDIERHVLLPFVFLGFIVFISEGRTFDFNDDGLRI